MKSKFIILSCLLLVFTAQSYAKNEKVLVFGKTASFFHKSIPYGMGVTKAILEQSGIEADTTRDASVFTTKNLKQYKAIVFFNTTGDVLNDEQQAAFQNYILKGGGFVGVHAAGDTEHDWPFYGELAGAYFMSHPKQQEAVTKVVDKSHPATAFLPSEWKRFDEWYDFKNISTKIKVLAYLDETSYEGGKNGDNHPFIWYQMIGKGRAFYTGVGHDDKNFDEPLVRRHLLEAIKWAAKIKTK